MKQSVPAWWSTMHSSKLFLGLVLLLELLISCAGFGQQPLLQITSPAEGAIVKSNQTITITVSADPSVTYITVLTESPLPDVQPGSTPTQFLLALPAKVNPRIYHLTAVGVSPSGPVSSDPINIDIEPQYETNQVSAEPDTLDFDAIGDQLRITAYGTFPDGNKLDITYSSKTAYISNDPKVVTVSNEGIATAVGPGHTFILVQGIGQIQSCYYPIEVEVRSPTIVEISPPSGPVATLVTIWGGGFGDSQGSSTVTFAGTAAAPTFRSNTSITVPVPASLTPARANVVVTVAGFSSNAGTYNVTSTVPASEFSISATPRVQYLPLAGSTSFTVSTSALNGSSGAISLSAGDLPAGVTASFSSVSIDAGGTSTLTLSAAPSAPSGRPIVLSIIGTSGGLTHSANVTFVIRDFSLAATPSSQTVMLGGGSTSYTVSTSSHFQFNGNVTLSLSGLPPGTTAGFSSTSIGSTDSATLNVATSASTPAGSYPLVITATSGNITHTVTVTLNVA